MPFPVNGASIPVPGQIMPVPGQGIAGQGVTAVPNYPSEPPSTGQGNSSSSRAAFAVQTRPAQPLTGQVNRFNAATMTDAAPLNGQVATLIPTSPLLGKATSANTPRQTFRVWLERSHPGFALAASRNDPGSLLEVKGMWDKSTKTVQSLGIPCKEIGAGDLRDIPLDAVKVIIINCAGNIPKTSYQRLRDWVANGGYLLTTDWALQRTVEKVFPGYVEWDSKHNRYTIYDSTVVGPDPVLFNTAVTNAHWKLDMQSQLVRVLKPGVRVLARSARLAQEDPDGQGALAVEFAFGRGYVLHLVGHFDNNADVGLTNPTFGFGSSSFAFGGNSLPDPAPVIGIALRQAIAANFIVAGLTNTPIPSNFDAKGNFGR
jgi:hypothetical protein